ncbi:hypothetical protein AVEN_95428-1 [Araneus ventricosus]|uniref:Uncharacterized protein n=1 Tax=Araneus ventricosus TaxID=182803 RepID=A0A4Y2CGV5_ARAVE|nr:hypothetical protein AVEN_95428-1 [Araneus ventricosus]
MILKRKTFPSLSGTASSVRGLLPFLQSCDQGAEGPHEKKLPTYNPYIAPSDFHLFPAMKLALSGRRFRSNEEVQHRFLPGWFLEINFTV